VGTHSACLERTRWQCVRHCAGAEHAPPHFAAQAGQEACWALGAACASLVRYSLLLISPWFGLWYRRPLVGVRCCSSRLGQGLFPVLSILAWGMRDAMASSHRLLVQSPLASNQPGSLALNRQDDAANEHLARLRTCAGDSDGDSINTASRKRNPPAF
jgi:hypothetical protein